MRLVTWGGAWQRADSPSVTPLIGIRALAVGCPTTIVAANEGEQGYFIRFDVRAKPHYVTASYSRIPWSQLPRLHRETNSRGHAFRIAFGKYFIHQSRLLVGSDFWSGKVPRLTNSLLSGTADFGFPFFSFLSFNILILRTILNVCLELSWISVHLWCQVNYDQDVYCGNCADVEFTNSLLWYPYIFFYIICYIRCIVNLTCRNKARILSSFFGSNRFKSYRFVCVVEDCNRFPLIGLTMSLAWEKSLPIIDVFQSIITCSFLEPRILDVYDTVFAFHASFHKVCSVSDLHELTTLSFYVDKLWSARAAYSRGTLRLKPSRASVD